jgi:hypothetical protein
MRAALGTLLAIAACSGGAKQGPTTVMPPAPADAAVAMVPDAAGQGAGSPDCATAIGTVMDRLAANTKAKVLDAPPAQRDQIQQALERTLPIIKSAVTEACTGDHWDADVRRCLVGMTSDADFDKCTEQLPAAQQQHLREAMQHAMEQSLGGDAGDSGSAK